MAKKQTTTKKADTTKKVNDQTPKTETVKVKALTSQVLLGIKMDKGQVVEFEVSGLISSGYLRSDKKKFVGSLDLHYKVVKD